MPNDRNNRNNRNNNSDREINEVITQIKSYDNLKDIAMKDLVDDKNSFAYKIAEYSRKENIKTHQLRKFFGAIRKMEGKSSWNEIEPEFYLLKPRIAVKVNRKNNGIKKPFYNVIIAAMNKVNVGTDEDKLLNFKVFIEFFEAIVAYHKFLGGD